MKNTVLKVKDMMCSSCEKRIETVLKDVDGVEKVKADHLEKTVSITYQNEVREEILKNIIEDIGYEVIE